MRRPQRNGTPIAATALLCVLAAAFPGGAAAATPKRTAPQGYIGVNLDPWDLHSAGINIAGEMKMAAAAGVEAIRMPIYWQDIQPSGASSYDWAALDSIVGAAGKYGIAITPTLLGAPTWAWDWSHRPLASNPCATDRSVMPVPRDFSQFATFAKALVERYGPSPNGTFWQLHPELTAQPITRWQIWNEPDLVRQFRASPECGVDPQLGTYWPQHVGENVKSVKVRTRTTRVDLRWAPSMVSLVRTARTAIRQADPNAIVLFPSLTNAPWLALDLVYYAGGKGSFDRVGVNLFTRLTNFSRAFTTPNSSSSAYSSSILGALSRGGDSKMQVVLTEFAFSSARGHNANLAKGDAAWSLPSIVTNESGQGTGASQALSLLASNRLRWRLDGINWYTWSSTNPARSSNLFDYAGLSAIVTSPPGMRRKPALAAFRTRALALEGCRTKLVAAECATR